MADDITKEVVDNYKEHSQHLELDYNCSECYNSFSKVLTGKAGEITDKCNGLHSGTVIWEKSDISGITRQYHKHPETGELIVMDTWYVSDGQDDVSPDFEVVAVYSPEKAEDFMGFIEGYNVDKETMKWAEKALKKSKEFIEEEIIRLEKSNG